MKIFVIVGGPAQEQMVSAFRSYEDGSPECVSFVLHSSCGRDQSCSEFQIVDLPNYKDGSEIFEFSAYQVAEDQKVSGMYNSQNQHGYLSVDVDADN